MKSYDKDRDAVFCVLAVHNGLVQLDEIIELAKYGSGDVDTLSDGLLRTDAITADAHQIIQDLADLHLSQSRGRIEHVFTALNVDSRLVKALGYPELADTEPPPPLSRSGVSKAIGVDNAKQPLRRFHVKSRYARGGLGEVMLAEDTELKRQVALKQIREEFKHKPDSRSRFIQEAEITGQLEHPGVVPIYGMGRYADGCPFYAMRLVKGRSLTKAIADYHNSAVTKTSSNAKNAQFRDLLNRFIDVCDTMQFAHDAEIIHRDIKPDNIILGEYGETIVVDWGLAKKTGQIDGVSTGTPETLHATQYGSRVGTVGYMSPEQAAGELDKVGPPTDIYGLGATLYHILTGRKSTAANTPPHNGNQRNTPPAPRTINRAVPAAIEAVCLKAMADEPAKRYESARALAKDIQSFLADEPVSAMADPMPKRIMRQVRKHPKITTALAASIVLCFVTFAAISRIREMNEMYRVIDAAQRGDFATVAEVIDRKRNPSLPLRFKRLEALDALLQVKAMRAELSALAKLAHSGEHEAEILLWEGDVTLLNELDARMSIRRAIEIGLPPEDEAYALSLLAESTPEAIEYAEEALNQDRYHIRAMRHLLLNLTLSGRFEDAERWLVRAKHAFPDDPTFTLLAAVNAMLAGEDQAVALAEGLRGFLSQEDFDLIRETLLDVAEFRQQPAVSPAAAELRWNIIKRVQNRLAAIHSGQRKANALLSTIRAAPPFFEAYTILVQSNLPGANTITEEQLTKAAQKHPDGVFHFLRGKRLAEQSPNELRQIERAFAAAARLPSLVKGIGANALFQLAMTQFAISDAEGDDAAISRAVESLGRRLASVPILDPKEARRALVLCEKAQEYDLARRLIEQQIQSAPNGRLSWLEDRCRVEIADGQYLRAMRIAQEALSIKPDLDWARTQQQNAAQYLRQLLAEMAGRDMKSS